MALQILIQVILDKFGRQNLYTFFSESPIWHHDLNSRLNTGQHLVGSRLLWGHASRHDLGCCLQCEWAHTPVG